MSQKTFSLLTGVIFLLIFILHLLRIIRGWDAVIGGLVMSMWLSWVAIIIAGYLAYQGFKLGNKP